LTGRKRRLSDARAAAILQPPTQRELAIRNGQGAVPAPAPRVFGYVRVSSDAQAEEGQSLDVQRRQLEGWAMQRGQQLDQVIAMPPQARLMMPVVEAFGSVNACSNISSGSDASFATVMIGRGDAEVG
jgi:hypothetical protein